MDKFLKYIRQNNDYVVLWIKIEIMDSSFFLWEEMTHERFLISRKKKMEESEESLRKTVGQMINSLKKIFPKIKSPGWKSKK